MFNFLKRILRSVHAYVEQIDWEEIWHYLAIFHLHVIFPLMLLFLYWLCVMLIGFVLFTYGHQLLRLIVFLLILIAVAMVLVWHFTFDEFVTLIRNIVKVVIKGIIVVLVIVVIIIVLHYFEF